MSMVSDAELRRALMNVPSMTTEKLLQLTGVLGELQNMNQTGPLEDRLLLAVKAELEVRNENKVR